MFRFVFCCTLNHYIENVEKSFYVLGSELWESKFDGLLGLVIKEYKKH